MRNLHTESESFIISNLKSPQILVCMGAGEGGWCGEDKQAAAPWAAKVQLAGGEDQDDGWGGPAYQVPSRYAHTLAVFSSCTWDSIL